MKTDYDIIRSDRRSVGLDIRPNGRLLVRAPKYLGVDIIEGIILEKSEWIERVKKRRREREDRIMPPLTDEERAQLYQKGLSVLSGKIEHYSRIMKVKPTRISITAARKRHGSCSGKNAVCFSYLLMQYPDELIDLVVVHELAHIRYKNHGRDFYKFIASVIPDYRERMALMREMDLQGWMDR